MFVNLLMLAGLGGAAIPLILHLLSRARYRSVDWGAMMFLATADGRPASAARVRQWLLLAARMAVVALLAVALARPLVKSRWGGLAAEGPITAVLVLDHSYSTSLDEHGRSRFERARQAALQVLGGLRPGDRVGLVLMGSAAAADGVEAPFDPPTTDLQAVARFISTLPTPSAGAASVPAALSKAADLLDRSDRAARELYIVCDTQAASWQGLDEAFARAFVARASRPGLPLRFFVAPVGGEDIDNVAVESVQVVHGPLIAGVPAEVEVRVRNYGPRARNAVPLTLATEMPGERPHPRRPALVNVPGGGSATVRIPINVREEGPRLVRASIQSPDLGADNSALCAIDVQPPVRVLVLSGDERTEPMRSESDYLRLALMPHHSARKSGGDPATVTVQPIDRWQGRDLAGYGVVVLANVAELKGEQAGALEQFVYEGGGLLVAPGALSRAEAYNARLYRAGAGLLPAQLGPPTPADGSAGTAMGELAADHPIFRFAAGRADPADQATIWRHFPLTAREGDARVLARTAAGNPLLVEGSLGRGRVLLLGMPLDADWSNLPLTGFYLPFLQSAARYLDDLPQLAGNLEPGQPLAASFDRPVDERSVQVLLPDPDGLLSDRAAEPTSIQVTHVGDRYEVRCTDTRRAGIYQLQVRLRDASKRHLFVVRTPPRESDLRPLSDGEWEKLRSMLGFRRLDAAQEDLGAVASARGVRELWLACLLAVLGLTGVELWAAGRWTREGR